MQKCIVMLYSVWVVGQHLCQLDKKSNCSAKVCLFTAITIKYVHTFKVFIVCKHAQCILYFLPVNTYCL